MKRFYASLIGLFVAFNATASGYETYNTGSDIIENAHNRSQYYIAGNNNPITYSNFVNGANKSKPVVIHLHGCGGVGPDDREIRDFYTGLGMNFVMTNFINRGDAKPSCTVNNNKLTYTGNIWTRLPARGLEMHQHIKMLKEQGFDTIIVTGHSEGAMVAQFTKLPIYAVIIHSMSCIPRMNNNVNTDTKFLQLLSVNDPLLTRGTDSCEGKSSHPNFKTIVSTLPTHSPFAEPTWKEEIKKFLQR